MSAKQDGMRTGDEGIGDKCGWHIGDGARGHAGRCGARAGAFVDVQELQIPYELIQGEVRSREDVLAAARGVEVIVHTAAIHGIHLRSHSPRDFYELNLDGTFNVWEAAVEAEVRGVVFSSTMGVYGESRRPASEVLS